MIGAKFISLETSGEYSHKGEIAGTNKVEDLHSTDLTTGVCAKAPGKIIVELKGSMKLKILKLVDGLETVKFGMLIMVQVLKYILV